MNVLDLFSGIGGFSLGLERAGMRTIAFCEIDPYCQAVLRKHWPDVLIFGDVRELTSIQLYSDANCRGRKGVGFEEHSKQQSALRSEPDGLRSWRRRARPIDVICGGFPCQDISVAGKGAGIDGERSGLWSEYARIIGEVRPRYVIVENVAALLGRGIERVLGDLAALGYDAEWHCIPAAAVGAPHRRDRVWIVAYASGKRRQQVAASAHGDEAENEGRPAQYDHQLASHGEGATDVADANGNNGQRRECALQVGWFGFAREIANYGDAARTQWATEPDVGRVAHGVPFRVDRLRSLGNAIVPQIAEVIGKAIMAHGLV